MGKLYTQVVNSIDNSSNSLVHQLKQLFQPVTITSPLELQKCIDSHSRQLICLVLTGYKVHQQPPIIPYAITSATLWLHSLSCWQSLFSLEQRQQLADGVERMWLQQISAITKDDINLVQQQTIAQLALSFHSTKRLSIQELSKTLWRSLHKHTIYNPSIGQLSCWLQAYITEWQQQVSSHNVISIFMLEEKQRTAKT